MATIKLSVYVSEVVLKDDKGNTKNRFFKYTTPMLLKQYGTDEEPRRRYVEIKFSQDIQNLPKKNFFAEVDSEGFHAPTEYRVEEKYTNASGKTKYLPLTPEIVKDAVDGSISYKYTPKYGGELKYPRIWVEKLISTELMPNANHYDTSLFIQSDDKSDKKTEEEKPKEEPKQAPEETKTETEDDLPF